MIINWKAKNLQSKKNLSNAVDAKRLNVKDLHVVVFKIIKSVHKTADVKDAKTKLSILEVDPISLFGFWW